MVSVATELLVVIGTRSQLQPEYRLGIDEMLLPLPTPLVVAARFEGSTITHEEGDVVHFANVTSLDDETGPGTGLLPHQVVVDS